LLLVGGPEPLTEPGTWGPTRGGGQPDTKARLLSVFAGRVLIGPPGAGSLRAGSTGCWPLAVMPPDDMLESVTAPGPATGT
jgi:hypothetical protein